MAPVRFARAALADARARARAHAARSAAARRAAWRRSPPPPPPLSPFSAGKSNVMDAISFVLGMKASGIRAEKLSDLIFRVEGATKGVAKRASVSLVYVVAEGEVEELAGGDELVFSRAVTPAGASAYAVNGNDVTADQYIKGLLEIGIDIKAKNFLVFQSEVDAVARKGPKDMLDFFEAFCGSAELREPVSAAAAELDAARTDVYAKAAVRKAKLADARDARAAREEADAYAALTADADALRVRLALLKLFYIDEQVAAKDAERGAAAGAAGAAGAAEEAVVERQREAAKAAAAAAKTAAKKELQLSAKGAQLREALERLATADARLASAKAAAAAAAAAAASRWATRTAPSTLR